MSSPVVKVATPFRADTPERAANCEAVVGWWQELGYQVTTSDSSPGVFNRAQAKNTAAVLAGDWDVVIFADADTVGEPRPVATAVRWAYEHDTVVWPFDHFEGLSEVSTGYWLQGRRGSLQVVKRRGPRQPAPGGIVVASRTALQHVGGFDEGFVGWGYEDVAFARAALTLLPVHRIEGTITHLWHPYDATRHTRDPNYQANRRRVQRYKDAEGNRPKMNALLNELEVSWPRC